MRGFVDMRVYIDRRSDLDESNGKHNTNCKHQLRTHRPITIHPVFCFPRRSNNDHITSSTIKCAVPGVHILGIWRSHGLHVYA
jgi:hypothetical protein